MLIMWFCSYLSCNLWDYWHTSFIPDEKCRSHIHFTLQIETGLINALVFCIQWIILMLGSPAIIRQRRPLVNISRILHKWIQSPLQICITMTHHSSVKALQFLLKLIMVFISSLLSSKSKTCMDKSICLSFMKTDWVILVSGVPVQQVEHGLIEMEIPQNSLWFS